MVTLTTSSNVHEDEHTPHSERPPVRTPPPPRAPREDGSEGEERFGAPLDKSRVLRVLRAGVKPLAIAFSVGLVLAIAGFAIMPRTYLATATLKYGGDGGEASQGLEARVRALTDAVTSLRGEPLQRAVARRMGHDSPGAIAASLEPTPEMEGGLLRIAARGRDAGTTARLANEAAHALLTDLERSQRSVLDMQLRTIDARLAAETRELAEVRVAYDNFRREHGISDLTTERSQQISSAAELRSQGDLAETEIEALEARVTQLRRDLARAPRMIAAAASTTSVDQQQLMRLEGELVTARSSFSADHPTVRALEMQVESMRRRIASGQGNTATQVTMGASSQRQMLESALATAEAELAAARERSTSIAALAEQARTRVSQFSNIEGEATQLHGAVRTHEALVEELRERRARIESNQRNPEVGFTFMTLATAPSSPEAVSKKMIVVGALPLLFALLVALALVGRDVGRGRMRTPTEMAYWARMPVIAATDWPKNLRGLDDIIADMDDFAFRASGTTLIVPASGREVVLAQTLAERLDDDWVRTESAVEAFMATPSTRRAARTSVSRISYPPQVLVTPAPQTVRPPSLPPRASQPDDFSPGSSEESTGMVRIAREPLSVRPSGARRRVMCWDSMLDGPKLRRAARLADRVAVVVSSGVITAPELRELAVRLGREDGVGLIVVDLPGMYMSLPDRVGPVTSFWHASRVEA